MSKTWKDNDLRHNTFVSDWDYRKFKKNGKAQKRQSRKTRYELNREYEKFLASC